jgi:hypothetical protein
MHKPTNEDVDILGPDPARAARRPDEEAARPILEDPAAHAPESPPAPRLPSDPPDNPPAPNRHLPQ